MFCLVTQPTNEWAARIDVDAPAEDVLRALTEPDAIAAWAPVEFEIDGLAGGRLQAGSRERVAGVVAGVRASFTVQVLRADFDALELVAEGPLVFHVLYRFTEREAGVEVEARVQMRRGGGLAGRLLQPAAGALLNGGALGCALRRLRTALRSE